LSIYAGLKTQIGSNVTGYNNKVFPLVAPEGTTLPYATYQQTFTNRVKTLSGYTGGLFVDYQINLYATTYIATRTAADLWIAYIKNFSGSLGDETVQSVQVLNEFEDMDYVGSAARYRTIIECRFYYVES
jgi:hypothetical protein